MRGISESHRFVRRAEERNSSDPEKSRRNVSDDLSASVIVTGRSGRQQLNKEEINISELTEIIVEEQKMLAQRRKIEVHTEIEPDITGYLDESFYIRMLDNLISNAVSYGKEGGNIKVTLHQIPSGVQGTVEDDGIGISRDDQVHIWERFYRVDASRTGKEEGSHSGLGLSMVKWIAQAHGGMSGWRVSSEKEAALHLS